MVHDGDARGGGLMTANLVALEQLLEASSDPAMLEALKQGNTVTAVTVFNDRIIREFRILAAGAGQARAIRRCGT